MNNRILYHSVCYVYTPPVVRELREALEVQQHDEVPEVGLDRLGRHYLSNATCLIRPSSCLLRHYLSNTAT